MEEPRPLVLLARYLKRPLRSVLSLVSRQAIHVAATKGQEDGDRVALKRVKRAKDVAVCSPGGSLGAHRRRRMDDEAELESSYGDQQASIKSLSLHAASDLWRSGM